MDEGREHDQRRLPADLFAQSKGAGERGLGLPGPCGHRQYSATAFGHPRGNGLLLICANLQALRIAETSRTRPYGRSLRFGRVTDGGPCDFDDLAADRLWKGHDVEEWRLIFPECFEVEALLFNAIPRVVPGEEHVDRFEVADESADGLVRGA